MSLQAEAINILKADQEVDDGFLWLIEVQSIEQAKKYYDNMWDLTRYKKDDDDSIIYYHENGSISSHATFNSNDSESFKRAVGWIADYLRGAEY